MQIIIQKNNIIMKKLITVIILLSLSITYSFAQHYTVHHSNFNSVSLSFKSDQIQAKTVKTPEGMFTQISMDEYSSSSKVGNPQLPVLSKLLEIPLCDSVIATVSNARYDEYQAADLGILYPIYPVQPSQHKSYTGEITFVRNSDTYGQDALYAEPLVRVEKAGTMRDVTLANIYVSPVQYNPVTGLVRIYRSLDVTVTFANADIPGTYELKSKYGSPMFSVASASVINPIELTRDEFSAAPIKYLIIANSLFANNEKLNQFVAWKKRMGYIVEVAYTNDPAVGTTTTSIKNYIMTHYNNATSSNPAPTFLLFIGDVSQLPPFNCSERNTHVSDLYYATWNSGDNIPDCYYGRFSAENVSQLEPQIVKSLMYEQYNMEDPSYLGKAVLIAGTDGNYGPTHGDGQINYIYNNYINTNSTTHQYSTVYKHNYNCSSQAATIRSEIGAGVGWANYTAHGGETGWSDPGFSNSQVGSMNNAGKYGIMIGNCCLTGKFNYSSPCFGETLLRTPNKGAAIYVGASEVTYWDEDYYWAVGVRSSCSASPTYNASHLGCYDRAFHTHGESTSDWTSTMGSLVQSGNMSVQSSSSDLKLYYWEIYHIFGDPSIRPYLGMPSTMTVTAPDAITTGTTSYSVQAVPFAYVALTHNNQLVGAAFADANGNANITFDPINEPGAYELAVSAQNYIQYFKTVNVIVPQGAYLLAESIQVSPATIPAAGSTIQWDLVVNNLGVSNADNAYAKITCTTPGIVVTTDSVYIGSLAANASRILNNAFTCVLPADAEDQSRADFTVTVYWGSSTSQKNTSINILAPNLIRESFTIQTPSGASVISPGDLVNVIFTNKNAGHITLPYALVDLTSEYTGAIVTSTSYSIFNLGPEQSVLNSFSVQVGSNVPDNTSIPLYYHTLINNTHRIDTIYMTVGSATETFESGDFSQYPWNNSGNYGWQITTDSPYAGSHCARSYANLGNSRTSSISISVNSIQSGDITYFRRVSSESSYDIFSFSIDGNKMEELSGDVSWGQASFPVEAGTHTYTFSYSKDYSAAHGSDCAWIDNVTFPGCGTIAPKDTTDYVGIEEHIIPTANVSIYPNPATVQLTVSSNEAIRSISIYDLSGRLIETVSANKESRVNLNVAHLNSGVYFIETTLDNQQTKTSKFIKQ